MTGSGVIATTIGNYLSNPIPAFAAWFCLHFIFHPSGFPRRMRSGCALPNKYAIFGSSTAQLVKL
jgi:hypothetical protein